MLGRLDRRHVLQTRNIDNRKRVDLIPYLGKHATIRLISIERPENCHPRILIKTILFNTHTRARARVRIQRKRNIVQLEE